MVSLIYPRSSSSYFIDMHELSPSQIDNPFQFKFLILPLIKIKYKNITSLLLQYISNYNVIFDYTKTLLKQMFVGLVQTTKGNRPSSSHGWIMSQTSNGFSQNVTVEVNFHSFVEAGTIGAIFLPSCTLAFLPMLFRSAIRKINPLGSLGDDPQSNWGVRISTNV